MKKRLAIGIEEAFILILILLSFMEFFNLLPADLDFGKKIASWTILAFLLYHASITKIFFGQRHKLADLTLLTGFFLAFTKSLIAVALALKEKGGFFEPIYHLLTTNIWQLERTTFLAGMGLVLLVSVTLTRTLHVKKPSILHVLHHAGKPKGLSGHLTRFTLIFLTLNAFFILIFNLLMEWLAIIVDSALLLLTLLFFAIIYIKKHRHHVKISKTLMRTGALAENFYQRFISLFHSPKTIYLGFSGLLVLHLLTDLAVYILPSILSFQDVIYLDGQHRTSLITLLIAQAQGESLINTLGIGYLYLMNIIAVTLLLIAPAYIWHKVSKRQGFKITHTELALFFSSIFALAISPAYTLGKISESAAIGVDLNWHAIALNQDPGLIALTSIVIALCVFALSYHHKTKESLLVTALLFITTSFTYYIYHYFQSSLDYYLNAIHLLWNSSNYLIASYFTLFLAVITLTYLGGWIIFLKETKKEYRYIR